MSLGFGLGFGWGGRRQAPRTKKTKGVPVAAVSIPGARYLCIGAIRGKASRFLKGGEGGKASPGKILKNNTILIVLYVILAHFFST